MGCPASGDDDDDDDDGGGSVCTTCINMLKFCFLSIECICVDHMVLLLNIINQLVHVVEMYMFLPERY
jgi:hypothetical protein